jgi:hypothetical protein
MQSDVPLSAERQARARRATLVAFAGVVALHLALLAYFAPPRVMFSKKPILAADYSLHVYQVDRARKAFLGWHKLWAYDPGQLAGQPAGVEEDLTSKGTELFVIGLAALGVAPGFAFNLFVLLVHLAVPFVAYASARAFRLTRPQAVVASLLWVLMWFFDSFMHWCWWVGMITWSVTCLLCVLLVALLFRAFESESKLWYLALGLVAAAITLIHPFGAIAVLVPCIAMYARAFKKLPPARHGLLWLCILAAASTILLWIVPLYEFRHEFSSVDTFLRPRLQYLVFDTFDLMKDAINTGAPVRTVFRTLSFAGAGFCLWRWKKAGDRRVLAFFSFIVADVAISYLSGYLDAARQTQPYRQIGPAMLAAALPAAVVLCDVLRPASLRSLTREGKLLAALALVVIVPRVARTILYYLPGALPDLVVHSPIDFFSSPLAGLNEPRPVPFRHAPEPPGYLAVRAWLAAHAEGQGRVVVSEWPLAEYLAASTDLPILGGIPQRNVPHEVANLFRISVGGNLPGRELRDYFERYAVGFVVTDGAFLPIDGRRDVIRPLKAIAGFRIYRTRIRPSYFLEGSGRVTSQSLNSIKVDGARGADVVLRFHWMRTLRCRPGCSVERFPVALDPVGFIRVPHPPPAFEIYNSYHY